MQQREPVDQGRGSRIFETQSPTQKARVASGAGLADTAASCRVLRLVVGDGRERREGKHRVDVAE